MTSSKIQMFVTVSVALLGTLITPFALAQQSEAAASATPAVPAAGAAAMQEFMKRMMPGESHKFLAQLTGKWQGQMKVWNSAAPSAPPMESSEESESKLIIGGRFVLEESRGMLMRMPMQRMSIIGYDNLTKVYTQVFYSSMETATNTAIGNLDATGKVLTLRGEFDEPQGKSPFRNVIRLLSDDSHVFESYKILPGGAELKVIEVTYARVK